MRPRLDKGQSFHYESNKKYSGNLELYARWEAQKEQVTFNGNGGTISGSSTKEVAYGTAYGTLPTATRTGHTFLGWYTASENGKNLSGYRYVICSLEKECLYGES